MSLTLTLPLNHKQEELAARLLEAVRLRFPEATFTEARLSPADSESVWLYVIAPEDEEREIELRKYAAEIESDIFQEFGYLFAVKPRAKRN